jgi:hypothetical protein
MVIFVTIFIGGETLNKNGKLKEALECKPVRRPEGETGKSSMAAGNQTQNSTVHDYHD